MNLFFAEDEEGDHDLSTLVSAEPYAVAHREALAQSFLEDPCKIHMFITPDRLTPLHLYSGSADRSMVQFLLVLGADVQAVDGNGRTPIYHACDSGCEDCVKLLLQAGACAGQAPQAQSAPIHVCAKQGFTSILELLLACEVNVDWMDETQKNPIHLAALHGHADCVALLLEHGANPHVLIPGGSNAAHMACRVGCVRSLDLLLEHGVDVDHRNESGTTPSMNAAKEGHDECLDRCIAAGVSLDAADSDGMTATHHAATLCDTACLRTLLQAGGYTMEMCQQQNGPTPAQIAITHGRAECLRLLLDSGVIDLTSQARAQSLVSEAILSGCHECVALLHCYGVDCSQVNSAGFAPIHIAADRDRVQCLDVLLREARVEVDFPTSTQCTALYLAATNGNWESVRLLLRAHADPNRPNRFGNTPVHRAALKDHLEVLRLLLGSGGNLSCVNLAGETPLSLAQRHSAERVVHACFDESSTPTAGPMEGIQVAQPRALAGPS